MIRRAVIDHIAADHIHIDIKTCNIEESQQKYRLATVNNRSLWGGGVGGPGGMGLLGGGMGLNWFQTLPSVSQCFRTFDAHKCYLTHQ